MAEEFDLVVLGGGTGGYVAAIRASQLGMKVAIVEKEKLGGTCLHKGCIPSKALLKSAGTYRSIKEAEEFGVEVASLEFNLEKAMGRKNKIIDQLHKGIHYLMDKHQVTIIHGYGRILGPSIFSPMPGTISIEHGEGQENTMIVPKFVLVATGSTARMLPGLNKSENIITSTEALSLKSLPEHVAIIGGGAIGMEWASLLIDLGVEVTVLEQSETILPTSDTSLQTELMNQLKRRGVRFHTNIHVKTETIVDLGEKVELVIEEKDKEITITADKLLISIGREANITDIGLENTAIQVKDHVIDTNEYYQTNEKHIYAIGDCIGGLQLAHVASIEGVKAVEHMNGESVTPLNDEQVPVCVYSYPEVASIGLTEKAARERYKNVKVSISHLQANGKAMADGDTVGFTKIIQDVDTDDLLGVHLIGDQVTNQISEASLATVLDASIWELSEVIRPHPSQTEALTEAALALRGIERNA